jgi:hypothetical protein
MDFILSILYEYEYTENRQLNRSNNTIGNIESGDVRYVLAVARGRIRIRRVESVGGCKLGISRRKRVSASAYRRTATSSLEMRSERKEDKEPWLSRLSADQVEGDGRMATVCVEVV